ncbi:hypothetical protein AB0J86_33190 [Micromonospora sp. NPDC049559]|uniref:hypothetical protein n=1 Tax=Micromonospora sp. NPDC049559 TaxID=3155923 RepID=UPI00341B4496
MSGFRTKLLAALAAVALAAVGAVFTPLGEKVANAIWPDSPEETPAPVLSDGKLVPNQPCRPGGPPLSLALSYDFEAPGSTWWATAENLPSILPALNANNEFDPDKVLAKYQPVRSQYNAGTPLKLIATGCGPEPVVIKNMYAEVTKRAAPLSGTLVWHPPAGNLDITAVGFDLDTPKPRARTYDGLENKLGGDFFAKKVVQVAPGEAVPMSIEGLTKRSYLEWSIAVEALVNGQPWNISVLLPGDKLIRSTAAVPAYRSVYHLDSGNGVYIPFDPKDPWGGI